MVKCQRGAHYQGGLEEMKIQTIEITNYKAVLGTHNIKVDGKNLLIYGENGMVGFGTGIRKTLIIQYYLA
jgi:hypothetical protein